MPESRLTRADVTLGKVNKIGLPFLFRIRKQSITVDGATYGVYTSRIGSRRETEVLPENMPLVTLPVDDIDAGIDALLEQLNVRQQD